MRWIALAGVAALMAIALIGCGPEQEVTEQHPAEIADIDHEPTESDGEAEIEDPPAPAETSGEVVSVNEGTFEQKVLNAEVPVLVDFYADWCPPCRALEPTMEQLASDYAGRAIIAKVDVDENPGLAERYEVRGIPALFLIKDGEVVDEVTGAQPQRVFERMLDESLAEDGG